MRWVVLVAAVATGSWAGCGSNRAKPDAGDDAAGDGAAAGNAGSDAGGGGSTSVDASFDPTSNGFLVFPQTVNRKLDILFVIDNSPEAEPDQLTLRTNIPRFIDVLRFLPNGLPDVHIAVVSSDMGAGAGDIPGCNATGGDNGIFKFGVGVSPLSVCAVYTLNAGATYISSTGGPNPQNNFTGDIAGVLQCIVPLGGTGCGFERPLASAARALGADGRPAPSANAGFLRPEAYLAIVLLSKEDDCSAASNAFYNVSNNADLASPLGPPASFRCNEFGHLCDGAPPRRLAPNGLGTDAVIYQSCVSDEAGGVMAPVSRFVAGIKALKADSSMITVSSIQGPVTPYEVHWMEPGVQTDGPWPVMAHSCTLKSGATIRTFADPGIRLQQFAQSFGASGLVYSICQDNLASALNNVATKVSSFVAPVCIPGRLADKDLDPGNGVQPDCTVFDRAPRAAGPVDTPVAACTDNDGTLPCWIVAPFAGCPAGQSQLVINRGFTPIPDGLLLAARCKTCPAGPPNPAAGCP